MLNKERHKKEIVRVGKPPETLRFKNSIVRKMNNSGYEAIRSIVETNDQAVQQPQLTTQTPKTDKNLIAHKKIIMEIIIKNLNKVYTNGFSYSRK